MLEQHNEHVLDYLMHRIGKLATKRRKRKAKPLPANLLLDSLNPFIQ